MEYPEKFPSAAFTLLELLVVVGLIAGLSFFLIGGLGGGAKSAALQSAQATMANLVAAARTKAPATGRKTRLLLNTDAAVTDRFLRCVVLQLARQPGPNPSDWDTITMVSLPAGSYVMPASLTAATGLVADPGEWKKTSTADLVSDLFTGQAVTVTVEGDSAAQSWTGIAFTPNGTLAALGSGAPPNGALVIALGVIRPPGSYGAGESPVQLTSPQRVRGLMLSAYGVPALMNDRMAF